MGWGNGGSDQIVFPKIFLERGYVARGRGASAEKQGWSKKEEGGEGQDRDHRECSKSTHGNHEPSLTPIVLGALIFCHMAPLITKCGAVRT